MNQILNYIEPTRKTLLPNKWQWEFSVAIALTNIYAIVVIMLIVVEMIQIQQGVPHINYSDRPQLYRRLFLDPAPWVWFAAVIANVTHVIIAACWRRRPIYLVAAVPHLMMFPLTWVVGFWVHSEVT